MRFLIMSGPGPESASSSEPHSEALFAAYMKVNEEMTEAGVLVTSEGLSPDGAKARVAVSRGKRVVTDGPFTEAKELLGGFYVIDVKSLDEAIGWAMRCPVGMANADVLEIRQMTGLDEIPAEFVAKIAEVAPKWLRLQTKKA